MIAEGPMSIPMGGKLPFLVLQNQCSEAVGAWNFLMRIKNSDTGGPSLVAVRMEYQLGWNFGWKTCEVKKRSVILLIFPCGGAFNVGEWGLVWLVLYTSLQLQIPCTYSLPALHIYSTSNRRHIWNPVEHLKWSFFCRNSQRVKAVGYFRRRAPSCIFDRMFGRILNATLPNSLL